MLIVPAVFVLAASNPSYDADGSSDVFSFIEEETVSTALRREQPISQAPSNVHVITAEDIRQSGAPDIPTVLRRIPGLEVMQITGAEFNVSARGNNHSPIRCSCWSMDVPSTLTCRDLCSGKGSRSRSPRSSRLR
ncbi:MAG TPA: TonB-dependent receptor plug domain-containing protein [Nitrospira sp.]|nr:TonB-dependent receptor plug domain-containing protein [Nitrospira sp.]